MTGKRRGARFLDLETGRLFPPEETPKKPRVFKQRCQVCQGDIKEDIGVEFVDHGPPIFGPGSRGQYGDVSHGYYCAGCGIKYQFVPKKKS